MTLLGTLGVDLFGHKSVSERLITLMDCINVIVLEEIIR